MISTTPTVLAVAADLAAASEIRIPVVATYDLEGVHEAYTRLEEGHVGGKIVLRVAGP